MIRIQYCHLTSRPHSSVGSAGLVTGRSWFDTQSVPFFFFFVKSFDTEIRVAFTRKVLTPSWRHFRVKFNTFRVISDAAEIRVDPE